MRPTLQILLLLVAAAPVVACGGSDGPTAPTQQLVAEGRLERGAIVRVAAHDGATAADSIVTNVTVSPAAGGVVTGTSVKLLQAGPLTVTATATDGSRISTVLDVKVPPTVFFDAIVAGNRDVYSVSLDGGEQKRWTTSTGEDTHPSVAGGSLVFSSTRDGNGELYSMPSAGGAEKRLTTTASNETQPVLNTAGSSIAYTSDAIGLPRIFVAPTSLATSARLTAAAFGFGGSIETDATWSATGDRIALMATSNGRANLFLTSSTAGSTPAEVNGSSSQTTDVEPAWSPDGSRIAFASTRAGGTQIFLLNVQTGAFTQVTSGANTSGQPGWLPDGRLVFTQFTGGTTTLWWLDLAAGGAPTEIPTGTTSPAHATGARP